MNFSQPRPSSRFAFALAALAALALAASTGCSRVHYRIVPMGHSSFHASPRPADREVPIYSSDAPQDGVEIATLISRRVKFKDEKLLQQQYDDIRLAALAVNADAVTQLALKPVRRSGWVGDPNTPFPSWKHGEWMEFELHGVAVIFPDKERELRAAAEAPLDMDAEMDAAGEESAEPGK